VLSDAVKRSQTEGEPVEKNRVCAALFCFVQAVWVIAMMGFVVPAVVLRNGNGLGGWLYALILIVYMIATFGICFNGRWAWAISVLFLAGYWVFFGLIGCVNFVANVAMFVSGHELYQDSPMTIVVVFFRALFGIVPGSILLFLGIMGRQHIVQILRGRPTAT